MITYDLSDEDRKRLTFDILKMHHTEDELKKINYTIHSAVTSDRVVALDTGMPSIPSVYVNMRIYDDTILKFGAYTLTYRDWYNMYLDHLSKNPEFRLYEELLHGDVYLKHVITNELYSIVKIETNLYTVLNSSGEQFTIPRCDIRELKYSVYTINDNKTITIGFLDYTLLDIERIKYAIENNTHQTPSDDTVIVHSPQLPEDAKLSINGSVMLYGEWMKMYDEFRRMFPPYTQKGDNK